MHLKYISVNLFQVSIIGNFFFTFYCWSKSIVKYKDYIRALFYFESAYLVINMYFTDTILKCYASTSEILKEKLICLGKREKMKRY